MNRILIGCAALALAGCAMQLPDFRSGSTQATPAVAPAPAPAPVQVTAKERLFAAIEGQNCVLTADNVGAILTTATIGQAELMQIVPELQAEGRAEVAGDGAIRVKSANCL